MDREALLRVVLRASAVIFAVGPAIGFGLLPAEFRWAPHHPAYERMIVAIYVALGVCLWRAAADPRRHVLLIDFTILSSVLHGAVMLYDSFAREHQHAQQERNIPVHGKSAALRWRRLPTGER